MINADYYPFMEWDLGVCAILSDIHGNRHALEAVLDDLSKERIDRIICLGDTIGYGAKPLECLDLMLKHADFAILGNHDSAALYDPQHFHEAAETSAMWTRGVIERSRKADQYFEYLGELSPCRKEGSALFVHGSPRKPLDEYVFPHDIYEWPNKVKACFNNVKTISVQGHTHLPGILLDGEEYKFIESSELEGNPYVFEDDVKCMVNAGSVGQPRDGDPRACYAIIDGKSCRYRRIEYNIEDSIQEILAVKDFEKFKQMAFRLRDGR